MRFTLALPAFFALACTVPFPVGSDVDPLDTRPAIPQLGRPLDVLIVVDNSSSMCEEHVRLMNGIFEPEDCPIDDVSRVPERFMYTTQNTQVVEEEVAPVCGFSQVLAAYQVDARFGFITTDVSDCDNSLQQANLDQFLPFNCFGETREDRGREPQRGCLQAAPGAERKFVSTSEANFESKVRANLAHIGTFGSGFERGLDAAQIFLTPGSDRAPGCEDDLASFLRDDARLLVIFLSDEDDCSHDASFLDENALITCTEGVQELFQGNTRECYNRADELVPVSGFADFLRGTKEDPEDVYTLVTAGLTDLNGQLRAIDCSATAEGPTEVCDKAFGASNIPSLCGPNGESENCCEADAAPRYAELAREMGAHTLPICDTSMAGELVNIAKRIAESP